ncbi:MAG: hypothetical protein U0941_26925 [Planctomycetaceae bacterium]
MTEHWRSKAIASGTQNRHFDVDSFPLIVALDSATQPPLGLFGRFGLWQNVGVNAAGELDFDFKIGVIARLRSTLNSTSRLW